MGELTKTRHVSTKFRTKKTEELSNFDDSTLVLL